MADYLTLIMWSALAFGGVAAVIIAARTFAALRAISNEFDREWGRRS